MDARLEPELLLQHGRFVRLLAFHLLRDAHAADDVAQEAWLRMLQQPPLEQGRIRPWLRRVVTNLARNRQRAEGNQRARQERAARPEALPSAVEEFERAELLRAVIDAVLALDEPYRSTILWRYFRGWDAPRLAAETDTPLATVRSREQRALEQLRTLLDRKEGGRAAWAFALGRLVDLPAPSAIPPAPSNAPVLAAKLGLLAALGFGVVFALRVVLPSSTSTAAQRLASSSAVLGATQPASTTPSSVPSPSAGAPGAAARTEGVRTALATLASRSSGESAQLQRGTCEVRGRFLLPGGAPAAGVVVHLTGYVGNEEKLWAFGAPEDWQDPETATDAEGRFTLVFAPPPAYGFELEAHLAGFAHERYSWYSLDPDEVRDLGEVELVRGGALEGYLLDARGTPISMPDLEVLADGQRSGFGGGAEGGREGTWAFTVIDPLTGRFRFEDLAPGRVRLGVVRKRNAFLDGPQAVVVAGETVVADIVHGGPDLGQRVTLLLLTRFSFHAPPEPAAIRLSGPGLEARHPRTDPPRGHLVFDALGPGSYSIEIDDPRYLPWSQSGVTPGSEVRARLVGNSALVLDVRDAQGNALPQYAVQATTHREPVVTGQGTQTFMPERERLHDGRTALPGGRVAGLIAGDYTLMIEVDGLGRRELEVQDLQPNETRALSIVFGLPTTLAGRVSSPSGAPVAAATVLLLEPAELEDSPYSFVSLAQGFTSDPQHARHELARTTSDAAGEFEFTLPRAGSYAVYCFQGALDVGSESVAVSEGERRAGMNLVLPGGSRIQGRLLLPPGAETRGLRVWAHRSVLDQPRALFAPESDRTELAADGRFALGPLAAGPVELVLLVPESNLRSVHWLGERVVGGRKLGTIELVEGEIAEVELDVSASLPGTAEVSVLVDGAPAAGLHVALVEPDGAFHLEHSSAGTGPDGRARMRVFPGTWRIRIEDEAAGWGFTDAAQLVVRPGETSTALVPIVFVAAELLCVDASSGAPLADQELLLTTPSSGLWPQSQGLRTDSGGRLTLRLPLGEYLLGRAGQRATTPLSWTAGGAPNGRIDL